MTTASAILRDAPDGLIAVVRDAVRLPAGTRAHLPDSGQCPNLECGDLSPLFLTLVVAMEKRRQVAALQIRTLPDSSDV